VRAELNSTPGLDHEVQLLERLASTQWGLTAFEIRGEADVDPHLLTIPQD
jgi:hypothetical protein